MFDFRIASLALLLAGIAFAGPAGVTPKSLDHTVPIISPIIGPIGQGAPTPASRVPARARGTHVTRVAKAYPAPDAPTLRSYRTQFTCMGFIKNRACA